MGTLDTGDQDTVSAHGASRLVNRLITSPRLVCISVLENPCCSLAPLRWMQWETHELFALRYNSCSALSVEPPQSHLLAQCPLPFLGLTVTWSRRWLRPPESNAGSGLATTCTTGSITPGVVSNSSDRALTRFPIPSLWALILVFGSLLWFLFLVYKVQVPQLVPRAWVLTHSCQALGALLPVF